MGLLRGLELGAVIQRERMGTGQEQGSGLPTKAEECWLEGDKVFVVVFLSPQATQNQHGWGLLPLQGIFKTAHL